MNIRRLVIAIAAVIASFTVLAAPAGAHPLGNFTINRYSRIEVGADTVKLRYIVDMAEIPTFQEILDNDSDRDGAINGAEKSRYVDAQSEVIRRAIALKLDGQAVDFRRTDATLDFPEGQGGLSTLRLVVDFVGSVPNAGRAIRATYRDDAFAGRQGWSEIVVRPAEGAGLSESSVPQKDSSDELRNYPADLVNSPITLRDASFTFQPGAANSLAPVLNPVGPIVGRAQDAFTELISTRELSPGVILISLLAAMGLGAAHAMSPGHGKTVVGSYLVGSRGTAKHALFLGATVTVTHTIGVFALGLVTLFLSRFILPDRLYPWLELISGLLVVSIGLSLFWSRLRLAIRGGKEREPADCPDDRSDGALTHTHGGSTHSHVPGEGAAIGWRSLLALGISGGLLPCPSALVVLLSAIALGRVGFGIILIVFFSIGLAGVLTGLGLLLVYAQRFFGRLPAGAMRNPIIRLLPVGSAIAITLAGLFITIGAFAQTRLL